MAVDEKFQRKGFGTLMLAAAEDMVELAGFRRVWLHVRQAPNIPSFPPPPPNNVWQLLSETVLMEWGASILEYSPQRMRSFQQDLPVLASKQGQRGIPFDASSLRCHLPATFTPVCWVYRNIAASQTFRSLMLVNRQDRSSFHINPLVLLMCRLKDAPALALYSKAGYGLEKEDCLLVSLWDDRRQLLSKFIPRRKQPELAEQKEEATQPNEEKFVAEYWQ